MIGKNENQRLETWVEENLARGKYGFSLEGLRQAFPQQSDTAIKLALKRLSDKGKIVSIHKGYYLIISPQYASKGILPPSIFLEAFMRYLQRPYYVGLLNAAAFHGASHQQPQEYFVVTNLPTLRPTKKRGVKLNYISVKNIPTDLLEQRKTETGFLNISNPVLTASDLIQFEKRVGGLNRVSTVLNELSETIKPEQLNNALINHAPITALQRLGYILEFVCFNPVLADALFETLKTEKKSLYRVPLKASAKVKGFSSENRWNIIVNTAIEIDE